MSDYKDVLRAIVEALNDPIKCDTCNNFAECVKIGAVCSLKTC